MFRKLLDVDLLAAAGALGWAVAALYHPELAELCSANAAFAFAGVAAARGAAHVRAALAAESE